MWHAYDIYFLTDYERVERERMSPETLYIVVPAYNESENIKAFVEGWYPIIQNHDAGGTSRLVIVDDGSKDDTYAKLTQLAETRPLLIPLTKPNGGHGSAVLYGYRYAIAHGATWIFQTDSDGQTNPAEFDGFWNLRKGQDALFGVRTHREDGEARKMVENVLRIVLRHYFSVNIPDANAPFRLMRASKVDEYIKLLPQDYNLPNAMLTTYFIYFHDNVLFKEISFKQRQGGTNSINYGNIIRIGKKALSDFKVLRKNLDYVTVPQSSVGESNGEDTPKQK